MWRKHRIGELDASQARALTVQFESDYFGDEPDGPRFGVMAIREWILNEAARLLPLHGLRAFDSIQLASAAAARGADDECDTIVCFDQDLRNAASAEGFALIPRSLSIRQRR